MKSTTRLDVTNVAARLTATLAMCCIAATTIAHEADDDDASDRDDGAAPTVHATCDAASVAAVFRSDRKVSVLLTKQFKKGDALALSGTPATPAPPRAAQDVCLVKLLVGPGSSGTAGAPSTSPGIGLEVWMPATVNWNKRIHNLGGGGWASVRSGRMPTPTRSRYRRQTSSSARWSIGSSTATRRRRWS